MQLIILSQLSITQNGLTVQSSQKWNRGDIVVNQQPCINVLASNGLTAVNGNRVATSLEHIQRGFSNIHINVFPNGAVKGLYEFAVKVDLRILIMMDSQDKLAGDFH